MGRHSHYAARAKSRRKLKGKRGPNHMNWERWKFWRKLDDRHKHVPVTDDLIEEAHDDARR